MKLAGKTDVGRVRQDNQDDYRAGELPGDAAWALVCDGMGGARGGREASQCACSVIERCFQEQYSQCIPGEEETFLKKALLSANRYVFQKALREESLAGMGTTAVCALVRGGKAYLSHAGDSRAYLYRDGKLAQLTHDHSYVQELVDCGTITVEEAEHHPQKNIITRALGVDYRLDPEFTSVAVHPGDISAAVLRRPDQRGTPASAGTAAAYWQLLRPAGSADPGRQRERRQRTTSRALLLGRGAAGGAPWNNLIRAKKLDGLYKVKELIGSGGMANVYKAVMRGQNGPVPAGTVVAVKVLRQEYMHDPDLVRRFKNESKAISLLNHPNIVKVYDVSVNDHLQYIVMEYVDGMTLREYLNERGGKLSSRETVHFISQILKALEHAHANGVVHRDIKPQNIMLLDNGQLRMMDFGIARISRADNPMLAGKAMGSVHYISPEQAKGDETDCTSDIYSVGVMMYEMLSGHLPFDADDMVEVAIKQISDQPKSLHEIAPEVPNALVEITEKAMAKLPQNRYASAREMLDALDTYVHNPSVMFEYKYITEDAPEKVVETYHEPEPRDPSERTAHPPQKRQKKAGQKAPYRLFASLVRHHHCLCTGLHGTVLDDPERFLQPDEQQSRCHPWRLYRHDQGSGHGHRSDRIRPDLPGVGRRVQQQLRRRLYL